MKTNLENLHGSAPLHLTYSGNNAPQKAYLEISQDGYVSYETNCEFGNAVPMSVHHGRDIRIAIPNHLTALGYRQLHESIQQELAIIVSGMGEEWNGNNLVGTLTDDAEEALDGLAIDSYLGNWDCFDYDDSTGEVVHGLNA